jgi:hypothetical protein
LPAREQAPLRFHASTNAIARYAARRRVSKIAQGFESDIQYVLIKSNNILDISLDSDKNALH